MDRLQLSPRSRIHSGQYRHRWLHKLMMNSESLPTSPLGWVKLLCFRKVYAEGQRDINQEEKQINTNVAIPEAEKVNDNVAQETRPNLTPGEEELRMSPSQRIYFELLACRYIERESGMERVKNIFMKDHRGYSSLELDFLKATLLQVWVFSFFIKYIPTWNEARKDFIREHRGTVFRTRFEASRRLQDHVSLQAGREAAGFSAKITFFSASFLFISQFLSSYNNKTEISDYVIAAGITGGLARVSMGLRGMVSGTVVGSALGLLVGALMATTLRTYGYTQEERHLEAVISKLQVEKSIIGETAFKKKVEELLQSVDIPVA